MMRTLRNLIDGGKSPFFLTLIVLLAVFMVGYFSAVNQADNSRNGCFRTAFDKVSYVNNFRAITTADREDSKVGVGLASRRIRGREADVLNRSILQIDKHIDAIAIPYLDSPLDRAMARRANFSCARVYPRPGLLP